jgi:hypothetical protein
VWPASWSPVPLVTKLIVFGCCLYLQVRDEDVFKGLDNMVKNFLVSMPLVADLRSPAMRPRHWQQLMDTTKVGWMRHKCMNIVHGLFMKPGTASSQHCILCAPHWSLRHVKCPTTTIAAARRYCRVALGIALAIRLHVVCVFGMCIWAMSAHGSDHCVDQV